MERDYEKEYQALSQKALKRLSERGFYFNGSTHKLEDIDNIKFFLSDFPFWNWIIHKPEPDDDHLHIHFLCCVRGTDIVKNVAERLHCDYGVVQKCRNQNTYARYMLHLGFDDKLDKYDLKDVHSSDIDRFSSFCTDIHFPISTIYKDFCALRSGSITQSDFVEKYKGEFSQLNFYQKIRVFKDIDDASSWSRPSSFK